MFCPVFHRARRYSLALLSCFALTSAHGANKATPLSGESIYASTCAACHATGVAGAPKFGDHAAWAPLIAEGQAILTGHAWVGVRAMPAQGGNPELKLAEFARAVSHMVNQSGGDWPEPKAAMLKEIRQEAVKRLHVTIKAARAMKAALQKPE